MAVAEERFNDPAKEFGPSARNRLFSVDSDHIVATMAADRVPAIDEAGRNA